MALECMLLHPAMQNILFSIHGHIMTTSVIVNRDRMMLNPVNQQMELAKKTAKELYQHDRPLLICNPSLIVTVQNWLNRASLIKILHFWPKRTGEDQWISVHWPKKGGHENLLLLCRNQGSLDLQKF